MRPTRRQLLGAGSLVLLAGCTDAPPPALAPVDPDVALRAAAVARERALLEAYDGALLALPGLASRLVPLRAEHAAHLVALTGPPSSPKPSAAPSRSTGGAPAVPPAATAASALAGLVQAERAAASGHAADVTAASRGLAGLLAALSASEASHPVVLA